MSTEHTPKVDQRLVDRIVARAQNCIMGLGDPKTTYSLDKYADKNLEAVALLLVDAHEAKYDLVSLMWAAMEEVAEQSRASVERLERELSESQRSAKFWEDEAARFCRNEFFYHDIVTQIGKPFGVAAMTSDDGSIQQDVLALKVPELVDSLRATVARLEGEKENVAQLFARLETEPCTCFSDHDHGCPYFSIYERISAALSATQPEEKP